MHPTNGHRIGGPSDPGRAAPSDDYALESDDPPAPDLPGAVVTAATVDELIDRLAADLVVHAENCVRRFGDFHLALTGDQQLDVLYRRLMYDPNYRRLPWRRTHLWMVAEEGDLPGDRFAPISETIVDHADIPPDQVHPIPVAAQLPDRDYEHRLREYLAWREKGHDRLDYVLLLMGPGGALAGFGPSAMTAAPSDRLVESEPVGVGGEAPAAVYMTMKLINAARFVAVVATGNRCATAISTLAARRSTTPVAPLNGEMKWYLDAEACSEASEPLVDEEDRA